MKHGEGNGRAKLSEQDVKTILQSGETTLELGSCYGVDPTTIGLIRNRRTWPHVEAEASRTGARKKLTADQVEEIRNSTGLQRDIAARFGIHPSLVSRIKAGKRRATSSDRIG